MTTLLLSIPGQPSREINLEHGQYRIGRDADNDIVLDSAVVSRKHGLLELRGEDWVYIDLDSRNGWLVDGERVHEVTLRDGVRLQLGRRAQIGEECAQFADITQAEQGAEQCLFRRRLVLLVEYAMFFHVLL